jgi:hypothetical protein
MDCNGILWHWTRHNEQWRSCSRYNLFAGNSMTQFPRFRHCIRMGWCCQLHWRLSLWLQHFAISTPCQGHPTKRPSKMTLVAIIDPFSWLLQQLLPEEYWHWNTPDSWPALTPPKTEILTPTLQCTSFGQVYFEVRNELTLAVQPLTTPTNNGTSFFKHDYQGTIDIVFSQSSVCPSRADDILVSISLNTTLDQFDSASFLSSLETGIDNSNLAC